MFSFPFSDITTEFAEHFNSSRSYRRCSAKCKVAGRPRQVHKKRSAAVMSTDPCDLSVASIPESVVSAR